MMRSFIFALTCIFASLPAAAAPQVYEYSGSVTSIEEYGPSPGGATIINSVSSTTMTPTQVVLGDTFHGRFVYDPDLNATAQEGYYGATPVAASDISIGFDAGAWHYASVPFLPAQSLFDDYVYTDGRVQDALILIPRLIPDGQGSLFFLFEDASASVLNGAVLPEVIDLDRFSSATVHFSLYQDQPARGVNLIGAITSLNLVSAVPEPSTWMLALAGLAVVGWRRRA